MHPEAFEFVQRAFADFGPFSDVIEIGGRDVNGSIRPLLPDARWFSIDTAPGENVDEVADAIWWRPNRPLDCVVCCEVFEHAPAWPKIIEQIATYMPTGGCFIATMATDPRAPHSAVDGFEPRDGEYYGNVHPDDLTKVLHDSGFAVVRTEVLDRGDLRVVAVR